MKCDGQSLESYERNKVDCFYTQDEQHTKIQDRVESVYCCQRRLRNVSWTGNLYLKGLLLHSFVPIRNVTIFQCCTPTKGSEQQEKYDFYDNLSSAIQSANRRDIKIIMSDLNAKIGHENESFEPMIGVHGLGDRNENRR